MNSGARKFLWCSHLAVLGLGPNGHLGMNEPGTPFDTPTCLVPRTPETIRSNAAYWGSEADVRALLAVVQAVARDVEQEHGAAAVLTNLGSYQDSKHLHVHVHSGPRRDRSST